MPFLIALAGLISAAAFWYWRAKQAREAGGDLLDAANDARLAAKRFAYRRRTNVHPADSVDDARLAAAGIVAAIASMDGPLSEAELREMDIQARRLFNVDARDAADIVAFGRWISGQCNTPSEASRRLAKRIKALAGPEAASDLISMVEKVATADGGTIGADEAASIATIQRTLAVA